jgi:DNA adenine methylase
MQPEALHDRAFQTILRNRISRGGIIAPGAGILKNGERGRGIKSRWYPRTLCSRIEQIASIRARITFIEGDGLQVLEVNQQRSDAAFFIDPPYVAGPNKPGSRLYRMSEVCHHNLFEAVAGLHGDFLMTYEDSPEIRALANKYGMAVLPVTMRTAHHTARTELLIAWTIDWARTETVIRPQSQLWVEAAVG